MMAPQHISQEDLVLYALESLSHDESAAPREHLAKCDECQAEIAMLRGDLAMLALSADQHPLRAGARERFAQRIAGELRTDPSRANRAEPVPMDRRFDRPSRFGIAGWVGWLAAAVLLIVAAGLGVQMGLLRARLYDRNSRIAALEASKSRAEQATEVLTTPTAQRVLLTVPKALPAPAGRVVYLASRGSLILQANNLAPVAASKTYELWLIPANGSAPIPAGLFRPDAAGNGSVVLPPIPEGIAAKAFGVTLENAAGSKTPTAPILLAGAVPASGT